MISSCAHTSSWKNILSVRFHGSRWRAITTVSVNLTPRDDISVKLPRSRGLLSPRGLDLAIHLPHKTRATKPWRRIALLRDSSLAAISPCCVSEWSTSVLTTSAWRSISSAELGRFAHLILWYIMSLAFSPTATVTIPLQYLSLNVQFHSSRSH